MSPRARWLLLLSLLTLAACSGNPVVGGNSHDAGGDAVNDLADVSDAADVVDVTDVVSVTDVSITDVTDAPIDTGPPRCTSNGDCPGRACDVTTGMCVECVVTDDTCPADRHCDGASHTCVVGCRSDDGCRVASSDGGTTGPAQRCDTTRHECVACLVDSHCPPGNLCVGNLCVTGCSATQPCPTGQTCCTGACVDIDSNSANCGACGMRCSLPGASAGCNNGRCVVSTCNDGVGDCDRDPTNGCEVDTRTTVAHCGACGMACAPRANSTPACDAARCVYACNAGFADCDGDPSNGCEVDTRTTVAHCGTCATRCDAPNGTPSCEMGVCRVASCVTGFADCNGSAADGCEVDTRSAVAHCGGCGMACPARTNTLSTCAAGACVYACTLGSGDCNGARADGCEVDLSTSELNCGACGRSFVTANVATARCSDARCQVVACATGFADCDGDASNGCEVDTRSSNSHCGTCSTVCAAGTACTASACRSTCAAGETYCSGRCVDTRTAISDCGACGTVCPSRANAATTCAASACGMACNAGFADCDATVTNGCEVDTRVTVAHCGGCGRACAVPAGATATCAGGACGYACNAGFADCDATSSNGCEIDTRTNASHCGACNARCSLTGVATATCVAGACAVGACSTGRGDCDGVASNGCEVDLTSSASHCGACGVSCGTGRSCQAGVCTSFPSTGADGVFDPTSNVVLPSGTYNYRSIRVRAGVTVTTSGTGVLDLRSQGDVEIAGTIDLSGGRGGDGTLCNGAASGGGATGNPTAGISNDLRPDNSGSPGGSGGVGPAGADGQNATAACLGTGGSFGGGGGGGWPVGSLPGCGSGGGGGPAGGGGGGGGMCCSPSSYGGRALHAGGAGGGTNGGAGGAASAAGRGANGGGAPYDGTIGAAAGCGADGEGGGGGGSIGVAAASDLAMSTTFYPGSGGGGGGGGHGMGGGGGGGALRLSTTTTMTVSGRILANGGRGGDGTSGCCGAGGGGGSGGAIMLVAPRLTVSSTATLSAIGGVGGVASAPYGGAGGAGGLGRIALMATTATCSLAGTFNPPLVSACTPTAGAGTRGRAYVGVTP